ncbi:trehalose 6-phosphate synthase [Humidesulfovibrio mexicanus]|uniref:Glucosylglycerol-phosphate synthase n=1 Tax=Humidesulfovibrio mexicanus TaxID=147047 RepID=A0A238Z461_9BACT|nr:trehalose-phosphatase [Humidesulfovibrio mexicanus]SNR78157.1 trehalose 6-phosphate synthase [Humidesulfovibrio mexicanus]
MKHWTQLVRSQEFRAFLSAPRKLLMLDYDGTLAPFSVERHKAAPYVGVRSHLETLCRASDWRVVIVSGRLATEVSSLLGLPKGLEVFGSHGAERLDPGGTISRAPLPPAWERALADARFWAEGQAVTQQLEEKHGCLALHVRGLTPPKAAELLAAATHAFGHMAQAAGAEVLPFDGGVELRCHACNKRHAVERLLAEERARHGQGLAVAYLGDDLTDEDAFSALGGEGLAVLVARRGRSSLARHLLRPPGELLEFLNACALSASPPAVATAPGDGPEEGGEAHGLRGRLVVVSNRLPVTLARKPSGWEVQAGAGGLVTALAPVLRDRGGLWIGSCGQGGEAEASAPFARFSKEAGYRLLPVELTGEEHRDYYEGFSNEIIWPLFHDFQSRCNFEPRYWNCYQEVNRKFARTVAANSREDDYVWVHDYHLMHVAGFLREQGARRSCGFFLHIPFPAPDIFLKLPWRRQVLSALLEHQLVGFQTLADRRNFIRCLQVLHPRAEVWGRGCVVTAGVEEKSVRIGCFPIGIDYAAFAKLAASPAMAAQARAIRQAYRDRTILLGVDRLDYSKGVPQRLRALRSALARHPELRERVCHVQVLVPSREGVGEYQELKNEIERLVTQINGEFTVPGWVPIHHLYRNLSRQELVAYYLASDVALVTPLRDGMNLVAKEYCASNVTETGALVLSEFAGAAAQFQRLGALLVNPYDTEEVADAIKTACCLSRPDRRMRMHKLRENVRRSNVSGWVDSFLDAAFSRHLDDFAPIETVQFHEKPPRRAGKTWPRGH